jgi:hypothetical protein
MTTGQTREAKVSSKVCCLIIGSHVACRGRLDPVHSRIKSTAHSASGRLNPSSNISNCYPCSIKIALQDSSESELALCQESDCGRGRKRMIKVGEEKRFGGSTYFCGTPQININATSARLFMVPATWNISGGATWVTCCLNGKP